MKNIKSFPRIIVDLDKEPWVDGILSEFSVVQLCVLKGGKKSFVNVKITVSDDKRYPADFTAIVVSKNSDSVHGGALPLDMDAHGDEREALNCFEVEV